MRSPNSVRIISIDIIRGFALCGMVAVHFMIYFGDAEAMNTWIYFGLNHVLGDWGASSFLMLTGISQVMSGRRNTNLNNLLLFKKAIIRGVYIFAVGLLMLALTWGPSHLWQWDILTLMGFSTITLFFCRFLPSWVILAIAALLAAFTPMLRGFLAITPAWSDIFVPVPVISDYFPGLLYDPAQSLETGWNVKAILQGFLFTGEFPVFPWLMFPLVGFVYGRRIAENKMPKDLVFWGGIGVMAVVLGLGLGHAGASAPKASIISGYIAPLSFYPDSFPMMFFQLGMSVTSISILYYLYDIRERRGRKAGFFARFFTYLSHASLTFYFLHYLLIGWVLALVQVFSGKYRIYDLMGAWTAFAGSLMAIVLLYVILTAWDRRGGNYKLEWFLMVLTKRFV